MPCHIPLILFCSLILACSFSLGVGVQCAANAMRRLPLGHSERVPTPLPPRPHAPPPPPLPLPSEPWLHAASGIAIGYTCSKVVQWTEQKQKVWPTEP